jgi:hypothetical protein
MGPVRIGWTFWRFPKVTWSMSPSILSAVHIRFRKMTASAPSPASEVPVPERERPWSGRQVPARAWPPREKRCAETVPRMSQKTIRPARVRKTNVRSRRANECECVVGADNGDTTRNTAIGKRKNRRPTSFVNLVSAKSRMKPIAADTTDPHHAVCRTASGATTIAGTAGGTTMAGARWKVAKPTSPQSKPYRHPFLMLTA